MTAEAYSSTGMLFNRPLLIDSTLSASEARARIRAFSISRRMPDLEAFRRRQVIGWRLSTVNEDFLFQPEFGDSLDVEGARFVGLVEPIGSGSRIRGRVVAAPLTKIVMSASMLAVVLAAMAALGQGREPAAKVVAIASMILGGAWLMVRYSLQSTSRLVATRLRQCLEATGSRTAA